ncbi:MAG TPA: hypothetical protein VE981_13395 [Planctomycetota bacterium]|nr:hypothetical protein [Planctomycetota bacterium]
MVPDIEREWIAEENRSTPQCIPRLLLALFVLLAIAVILYLSLG